MLVVALAKQLLINAVGIIVAIASQANIKPITFFMAQLI